MLPCLSRWPVPPHTSNLHRAALGRQPILSWSTSQSFPRPLLPSGRRSKSLKSQTTSFRNSFFPAVPRLLNRPLRSQECSLDLPIYLVVALELFSLSLHFPCSCSTVFCIVYFLFAPVLVYGLIVLVSRMVPFAWTARKTKISHYLGMHDNTKSIPIANKYHSHHMWELGQWMPGDTVIVKFNAIVPCTYASNNFHVYYTFSMEAFKGSSTKKGKFGNKPSYISISVITLWS